MNCGLELCIYNKENICILGSISIDEVGGCADCVLISIEKTELDRYKAELLEKYLNDK